jgi:hypothetical protein
LFFPDLVRTGPNGAACLISPKELTRPYGLTGEVGDLKVARSGGGTSRGILLRLDVL